MSAEHIRPCRPDCDHGDQPHLSQGYYCARCGGHCNMLATGHGEELCEPNRDLVTELDRLNRRAR